MSSGDVKEFPCSENEGKTELIPPNANLESKEDQPSVPVVEGSGDHLPPSNAMSTTADDAIENTAKIIPEDTGGLSKDCTEVSEGNSGKEMVKISVNQSNCENKSLSVTRDNTELPVSELNISPSIKKDIITVTKPTFLEGVSSLASDDVDSENQDEDLVLKWDDDDEEENLMFKDEEIDKNTVKDASIALNSVSDLADNETRTANTNETHNVADDTLSKDVESITEVKSSEDDGLDDDQEDLLSEIDAQIAELGASISKAENEGLMNIEKPGESKIPMKNNDSSSESIKPSVSDEVIEIDMTEETADKNIKPSGNNSEEVPGHSKNEEMVPTDIEIEETYVSKSEGDNKQTELAKEDLLLKDDSNDSLVTSPNTEAIKNQMIVISVTENIVEKSQKESINEMDVETCANLDGTNLSLDHNLEEDLLKYTETQANSTKIDIEDVEMEVTNKDDSFVHDSLNSLEEKQHGVNKPNVMLEIPTQELIDLDDSVIDNELGNNSLDLPDSKNESNKSIDESVFETNTVEKETLIDNVSVEQVACKSTDRILDVKCPSSNQLQIKLNDNQVPGESVPKNDTLLLESVTCIAYAVTEPDKSLIQDITEISQEHPATQEDSTISKVDVPTTVLHVEAPSTLSNVDTSASISNVQTPTSISNVETPTSISNVEIPTSTSNVESPTTILNVEIPSTASNIEAPTMISDVQAPKQDEVSTPSELKVSDVDPKLVDDLPMFSLKDISTDNMDVEPTAQMESQPSLDQCDDAAEVTDSLGLLAESSRVRDEDDGDGDVDGDGDADGDDQETSEHDDDDDDFDPDDESSNQQTAEHSEEDSALQSESDLPKTQPDLETEVADSPTDADKAFDMLKDMDKEIVEAEEEKEISEVADKEAEDKELNLEITEVVSGDIKETEGEIDIEDEIVCEEVELPSDNAEVEENEAEVDPGALKDTVDDTTTEEAEPKEMPIKVRTETKLRELLESEAKTEDVTKSPSKKKLEISKPKHVVNIVDLESSSEDEGVAKPPSPKSPAPTGELTSVNISSEIEVMSSGDNTSNIISKQGETVITVPKTNAHYKVTSRLNTSEITIKTASHTEPTLVIPETTMGASKEEAKGTKFGGLEVFNLDSDDEEAPAPPVEAPPSPEPLRGGKCANPACAGAPTAVHYDVRRKRRVALCEKCLQQHFTRANNLVEGIKIGTPLLSLEDLPSSQELVEISDSDDDEAADDKFKETIGEETKGMLERDLADMINATWEKFHMDARLKDAQDELTLHLDRLERESAEVSAMLDSCQMATDKLRGELYSTFTVRRHHLPPYIIYDTPDKYFMCPEVQPKPTEESQQTSHKRRLSSASESQPKKPAIPLPNSADNKPEDNKGLKIDSMSAVDNSKMDDDKDVSVVTLSAESAPPDLPPCGEPHRASLNPGQTVYAMRSAFGYWIKANILEVIPKIASNQFTQCKIKYENKTSRNAYKTLPARCLAYFEPANVRMTIGTRVVALFKDQSPEKSTKQNFSSGIVAEVPNPVNKYRYLIFFDDGYAQYVQHKDTRLVCECSALVWEEVHAFSREFVRQYLTSYPERPMVRLHTGQSLKTEWNGKWWLSRVLEVDASLVHVYFEQDKRTEWIYRGSTRLAPLYLELQAAEKHRARPLPRNRQSRLNMPYVEYTRLDEQESTSQAEAQIKAQQEEIRRQRAVAKKSTTPNNLPPQQPAGNLDAVTSRVVYYTPKNAVKPYKLSAHSCGPKCKRTDVLALKDLRTYNPLAKPLLSGWERQIVRFKGHKEVMYRAPCGRRLRNMAELHRYLRTVNSDMGVDLFDFGPNTHCLAEFVLNKCIVGKKDLSHGKENVPVPCVNYYDESLPEFCSYNTERTPTAGVPLNLDPEFLCGCACTDDCQDKSKCACWKMTLEGAKTIGMDPSQVGYVYKRLPDPLPSGIYECNVRCKCKATCLNRVAQHPLQLKLQVFKTLNRGWGIRALNDVPKGSFLCIYAGNLLTDATANLDGLNEGDEYLAELDYIEVVEQMKEGYEDDIPEQDKKLDRKESGKGQESESEESESEEEASNSKSDADDGDFEPGYIPGLITDFNKRLRKRDKKKQKEKKENGQGEGREGEEDCITISDDEELREPSRFAAQAGMGGQFISKYSSVRTLFGKDEACYIMDAKVQGNIGRYLNHSCSPNVFVQNVFVDTHDPRFPWVAFFALAHIRAGTELTWNYNYDVGSVPGKALYCYCGAPNCRGRLL